ncbi:MAG: hypothetical protein HQL40_19815 [Alphaproteobacteria bacterium]|nr:hypothetical protein [Alphaproteobacteria bacterium]
MSVIQRDGQRVRLAYYFFIAALCSEYVSGLFALASVFVIPAIVWGLIRPPHNGWVLAFLIAPFALDGVVYLHEKVSSHTLGNFLDLRRTLVKVRKKDEPIAEYIVSYDRFSRPFLIPGGDSMRKILYTVLVVIGILNLTFIISMG